MADAPAPWWDEFGRVQSTGPGTPFESIFGLTVNIFRGDRNVIRRVNGMRTEVIYADISPTRAKTVAVFDSGRPAITEATYGRRSASYIGFEASLLAGGEKTDETTAAWARRLIVSTTVRSPPRWSASSATVYRRVGTHADRFFLINDRSASAAEVRAEKEYYRIEDAVTGEDLGSGPTIRVRVEANSARWIRAEHQ